MQGYIEVPRLFPARYDTSKSQCLSVTFPGDRVTPHRCWKTQLGGKNTWRTLSPFLASNLGQPRLFRNPDPNPEAAVAPIKSTDTEARWP